MNLSGWRAPPFRLRTDPPDINFRRRTATFRWPRPNSRVTRCHLNHANANRVFMSRSNRPYGFTCSQISGVSAA